MIEVIHASYSYEGAEPPVVEDANLTVASGECVALVGKNGSGKSTLARLMRGSLAPSGGKVLVDGHDATSREAWPLVGMVGQDPASQMVSSLVEDEVAFGPRNLGLDAEEVARRVRRALSASNDADHGFFAGNDPCGFFCPGENPMVEQLSGGQLQHLALAGVMALEPKYIVADEAASQLDADGRAAFTRRLSALLEQGVGVLMVSHLLEQVVYATRVVLLEEGRIGWVGTPWELLRDDDLLERSGLGCDVLAKPLQVLARAGLGGERGDTLFLADQVVDFARRAGCLYELRGAIATALRAPLFGTGERGACSSAALREHGGNGAREPHAGLRLSNVCVNYEGTASAPALSIAKLVFNPGEIVLVAGRSGSGKSTLARVAAGVLVPNGGTVTIAERPVLPGDVGLAFQRPEDQLFCSTVLEDVAYGPRNRGLSEEDSAARAEQALGDLGVPRKLWDRSPFELSGGERRRAALAGIVAQGCEAYVFDEPTAGLDGPSRELLHATVRGLSGRGYPVVVVSHDVAEWLPLADRVVLLRAGEVAFAGDASVCCACGWPFERVGLSAPLLVRWAVALAGEEVGEADANTAASGEERAANGGGTGGTNASSGSLCERSDGGRPSRRVALPVGTYVAACTPLHRLDARVKLLLVLALTVAVFAAGTPLSVVLLLAAAIACERAAGISAGALVRALKPTLVVLVFSLLANALRVDGSGDVTLVAWVGLSIPGLARGALAVARIVAVVAGVLAVSASTTGPQIADALGSMLRPLGKLGAPVDDLSMVISVALRFLPECVRSFDQIHAAQRARGAHFDEGKLSERLGKWVAVLVPMVVALFRRADDLARAMHDRCYGYAPRTASQNGMAARDLAVLAVGCAFMAAVCVALR